MRRLTIGLALLAVWAAPSFAQQKPDNALSADERIVKSEADAVDRLYKSALDRTRNKSAAETRVDPWSNMRGSDASKTKR